MARKLSEEQYDLRDVMNTRQGRAVLTRLLDTMGYWSDMYDPDPYVHARNSGARAVAVDLAGQLERDFADQWLGLLRERVERNNNTTREEEHGNEHSN